MQRAELASLERLVAVGIIVVLAVVAGVLAATGGLDDASPSAVTSPEAEPTAEPTATVTPPSVLRVPIRWLPAAQVVDLPGAVELADPFAADREQLVKNLGFNSPGATVGPTAWSISVVGPDGVVREVYATRRWLDSLMWDGSGIAAGFWTKRTAASQVFGAGTFAWKGEVAIDPATGAVTTRFEALPRDCSPCEEPTALGITSAGPGIRATRDPSGRKLLVTVAKSDPSANSPVATIEAFYVVSPDGSGQKLEGDVKGVDFAHWVADGRVVLAMAAGFPYADAYFVPTGAGEAVMLPQAYGLVGENGDWFGASRFVFVIVQPHPTSRSGAPPDVFSSNARKYVGVYDANSNEALFLFDSPVADAFQLNIRWPAGAPDFYIGGSESGELVDATTGAHRSVRLADIPRQYHPVAGKGSSSLSCPADAPSPGGRYVVGLERSGPSGQACFGPPTRLLLTDRETGATKALLEWPEINCLSFDWLNETRLILNEGCPGSFYTPQPVQISLVHVTSGVARALTDGPEDLAAAVPSPDGTRIAVRGARLRVYDQDGTLLRDYGSPAAGFELREVAWSPDGSSLAFLMGPANWD